jgi:hypothetical protein
MAEREQRDIIHANASRRKLFFRDFQVLRVKSRVFGKALPINQVLVKLREPGQSPKWEMLEREVFDQQKHFRAVKYLHSR